MSKKNKTTTIELPQAYALLEKPTATMAAHKIVIDREGKIHAFPTKDSPIPQEIAIDKEFLNMDEALKHPQTILAYHEQYLGEVPKKQGIAVTAAYLWSYFCREAKPHLDGTNADGTKKRESSLDERVYTVTTKKWAEAGIPTRQAKVCYEILCACLDQKGQVTEKLLKSKVDERQAEIKTKQDPWRIFQYYRPALIKAGLIRCV